MVNTLVVVKSGSPLHALALAQTGTETGNWAIYGYFGALFCFCSSASWADGWRVAG